MIKAYIFFVLIGIMVMFTLMTTHMIMHEQAHEQIAYNTGGYNCSISLGFGEGHTYCEDFGDRRFHALNEIVGYNMLVISEAIIFAAILIGIALLETRN